MYALGDYTLEDIGESDDPRSAYVAWAAAVKQYGGAITNAPHVTDAIAVELGILPGDAFGQGSDTPVVAARYPRAFVFPKLPSNALNPVFHRLPDDMSNDGAYAYYVAPAAVQEYGAPSGSGGITTPQSVPGEPSPPKPEWYDNLLKYAKYAGFAVGAVAVLDLLSFLPRRR